MLAHFPAALIPDGLKNTPTWLTFPQTKQEQAEEPEGNQSMTMSM